MILSPRPRGLSEKALSVTDILNINSTESDVIRYAAISEKGSEHSLGEAILKAAKMRDIDVPDTD